MLNTLQIFCPFPIIDAGTDLLRFVCVVHSSGVTCVSNVHRDNNKNKYHGKLVSTDGEHSRVRWTTGFDAVAYRGCGMTEDERLVHYSVGPIKKY